MDDNYGILENVCYIFEYSFDVGVKTEALKIIDEKYIESDTYVAKGFISYFLFSYYRIGKHLCAEPYKNPYDNFGEDSVLKLMLKNALNENNRERTKVYFDNISLLLKNKYCHNEMALKCLCEFMNVKMPKYESDLLNDIPITLYATQDKNLWFNYLKKNTKPINKKHETIMASGNIGIDNFNMVYKINSLLELWLASLYILFSLNGTIKICKNCGKPFILYNQKNISYCSYNGDKCRNEGRKAKERVRYCNERNRLYKNIYTKLKYRTEREKSINNQWNVLYLNFSDRYSEYKNHGIDDNKIIDWLKNVDIQYKEHKNQVFELPDIEKNYDVM